jgi:hypothetical protein
MKRGSFGLAVGMVLALQSGAAETPPAFMGDWEGEWVTVPERSPWQQDPGIVAHVLGLGGNQYEIQLLQEFDKRAPAYVTAVASETDGVLRFEVDGWACEVTADGFTGRKPEREGVAAFALSKVERLSPTLGREPPTGAVVLMGGDAGLDAWEHGNGRPATWQLEDGVVTARPRGDNNPDGGDVRTKQAFKDCELHMEFRLPYEPANRGQGRANSGVFLQGTYEVQILDSYALPGYWNECGALYKVWPPKVNMCAPPGQWQSYDIVYRSPRFAADGSVAAYPRITVRQNGVLIHNDAELTAHTSHSQRQRRTAQPPTQAGPIILQDHGHPIQFRNMWITELPAE